MKCIKCGADIPEGNAQCNLCGLAKSTPTSSISKNPFLSVLRSFTKNSNNTNSNTSGNTASAKPTTKILSLIISLVIFISLIIIKYLNIKNDKSIEINNQALQSFETGTNYDNAIVQFQTALQNATTDSDRLNISKNLAYAYLATNDYSEALKAFKQALTYAKDDLFNQNLIKGEIALLEKKPDEALKFYKDAYTLKPTDFQINSTLGVFYLGVNPLTQDYQDFNEALKYNLVAYKYNPTSETMKENLAWNYYYVEKYNEAINLLKTTSLQNKSANNYLLAMSYYQLGDDTNAKKYLQKAIDLGYPASPEELNYLNYLNENELKNNNE